MTKIEKRLFIREGAQRVFSDPKNWFRQGIGQCWGVKVEDVILQLSKVADGIESFERKQDEEDAMREYACFGDYQKDCRAEIDRSCKTCIVLKQCQEKRGAK